MMYCSTGRQNGLTNMQFLFYDRDVKSEKGITYLPHYMLPCMGPVSIW